MKNRKIRSEWDATSDKSLKMREQVNREQKEDFPKQDMSLLS